MLNAMMIGIARARVAESRREPSLARLKRAGYADAERLPRLLRHWANR